MNTTIMKLSAIKQNPNNPRSINKDKFAKLVKSIEEFPRMLELRPIVLNKDNIVLGGNMRLKACKQIGLTEVPVVYADDLTEEEQRQFIIKDNVGFGDWDWELLANEWDVSDLNDWGLDLPDMDVEVLEAEEDNYEEPDNLQVDVVLGDLIEIGEHRLLCGDSTDPDNWEKLKIEPNTICFTSPPYNVGDSSKLTGNKNASKKGNFYESYKDDSLNYVDLISNSLSNALSFTEGTCFNVQPLANNKVNLIDWLHNWKECLVDIITWDKGHSAPIIAKGVCSSTYEWLVVFNKKNNSRTMPLSSWQGTLSNVYSNPPQRNNEFASIHAATFPIHLPEFVIGKLMNESKGVVDCFIGTGTTMVAAHQLNRKCYGMELDPKYCQVIIDRMVNLDPTLEVKINGKRYDKK